MVRYANCRKKIVDSNRNITDIVIRSSWNNVSGGPGVISFADMKGFAELYKHHVTICRSQTLHNSPIDERTCEVVGQLNSTDRVPAYSSVVQVEK